MENVEDMVDRALAEAYISVERARKEITAYHEAGKEIIQVVCDESTKRGDIIEVQPLTEERILAGEELSEEEADAEDTKKVRVIVVHGMTGIDPETMEMHRICDAICVVLNPGDVVTEEEFASMYGEGDETPEDAPGDDAQEGDSPVDKLFKATSEELGEAAVAQAQEDAPDPNVCSCGANREMCERNQNVFGGHLNEQESL